MTAGRPGGGRPETPSHASEWRVPVWLERGAAWGWRFLVIGAGILALVLLVSRLRVVLLPVLIALLLAALTAPLAAILVRLGVPRLLAAWFTLLLGMAIVAGVVWVAVVGVGDQLVNNTNWDAVRTEARTWLEDGPLGLSEVEVTDLEDRVAEGVVGGVTSVSVDRVRLVAELVGGTLLSIVLFFFFVKDGPQMWNWFLERVSPTRRAVIDRAGRSSFDALSGYIRGVAITGVVDAVFIGLGLWLIGVPLVVPLMILTFFGAFFPIVGATLAGALAALVALVVNGPTDALLVVGLTLAVQQLEGDLVMPLVMRRRVAMHPAAILLVLAVGGALAGIVGAFVAVPVAAMIVAASSALSASPRDDTDDTGDAAALETEPDRESPTRSPNDDSDDRS